jgi:hypothetical protein
MTRPPAAHLRGRPVPVVAARSDAASGAGERAQAWQRLVAAHQQLRAAGRDIRAARARLDDARHEYTLTREAALRIWTEHELAAARVPGPGLTGGQ